MYLIGTVPGRFQVSVRQSRYNWQNVVGIKQTQRPQYPEINLFVLCILHDELVSEGPTLNICCISHSNFSRLVGDAVTLSKDLFRSAVIRA
jgi:hypothetical protein